MNQSDETQNLPARAIADGIAAARRNRSAGLALWTFGCVIIAGYFFVPAVRQMLDQVAEWKVRWGFLFSVLSTGLFGGLIPSLIQMLADRKQPDAPRHYPISNTLFWGVKGIEIDLLYRIQAMLFGSGADWQTVGIKTMVDQFIYVPALGLPNVILFYLWRDCGYDCQRFPRKLGRNWYRNRILPVLIANWFVWVPAVVLIYVFPLALQLPIQNLILCFWILMLTLLTNRQD